VATLACGAVVVGLMHYFGVPLPSVQDLLHQIERIPKLPKILS
jgi:hypothetical protein